MEECSELPQSPVHDFHIPTLILLLLLLTQPGKHPSLSLSLSLSHTHTPMNEIMHAKQLAQK